MRLFVLLPVFCFMFISQVEANHYALQFNGTQQVQIPHSASLSFSNSSQFTIELWIYLTDSTSVNHFLGKRQHENTAPNYQLAYDPSNLTQFNSGNTNYLQLNNQITFNTWTHLAVTYDGYTMHIYVNGILDNFGDIDISAENSVPLKIGESGGADPTELPNKGMKGYIDEVRIWDRQRDSSEVAYYFNRTITNDAEGLVGYWNFDEDSLSQDVIDLSLMNNNGILGIDYSLEYDPIRVNSTLTLMEAEDNDNDGFTADVDCDDNDPYTYPGAAPNDDIDACMRDADEDDFGDSNASGDIMPGTDCDDSQPLAYPGAVETWYDGIDQNCDGLNDFDQDGDGYVHIDYPEQVGGSAPLTGDCDDENPDINPGAVEVWYDGIDQNCDGLNDYDADFDGYVIEGFESEAGGSAPGIGDCDDDNETIHPGASETWYDGIDQNCDGMNDYDQDGDGYVHEDYPGFAGGSAPYTGDCDDTDPDVSPATVWYFDADDDGWGIENDTLMRCLQPAHYVLLYPDNCPLTYNPDQADTTDGDGVGIACDDDDDDDGIDDTADYCQFYYDPTLPQRDADADKVGDSCDNCIHTANGDQTDSDGDGRGDACDICPGYDDFGEDSDGDGIPDECDCISDRHNCGDTNGDCSVNIGDAVYLVNYIFKGGNAPQPLCVGDANNDIGVNIGDAVYLISYIFRMGPYPGPNCCTNWPLMAP